MLPQLFNANSHFFKFQVHSCMIYYGGKVIFQLFFTKCRRCYFYLLLLFLSSIVTNSGHPCKKWYSVITPTSRTSSLLSLVQHWLYITKEDLKLIISKQCGSSDDSQFSFNRFYKGDMIFHLIFWKLKWLTTLLKSIRFLTFLNSS